MGLFDFVGDVVSGVGNFFSDAADTVGGWISGTLGRVSQIAPGIGLAIGGPIGAAIGTGVSILASQQDTTRRGISRTSIPAITLTLDLSDTIQELQRSLVRSVELIGDDLIDRVGVNISETAADAITTQAQAQTALFSESLGLQTAAIVATAETERVLAENLIDFIDNAGLQLDELGRTIADDLGVFSGIASAAIGELIDRATLGLSGVITRLISTQQTIEDETRELIRAQSAGAESLAGEVGALAEGVASEAESNREALMAGLEAYVGRPLGSLGDQVWDAAKGLLGGVVDDDGGKLERGIRAAAFGDLCGQGLTQNLAGLAESLVPDNAILRWLMGILIAVFTWMSVFGGITSAQAQTVLQEYGQRCAYKVLSPPDAILAHFRGQIDRDEMLATIQAEGFSRADAQSMWISSLQIPNELDLLAMWLREIITEDELNDAFQHRGWDPGWTAKMKQSARLLPPPQDLISMAVREAFSPAAIDEFGLMEDFPEEFSFWAEKQGVSRDWALKYWAAHWGLPSVQMGYEMLHRDVIDERQLQALMKALDIVPAWRDKLIAISYTPYTRVDIRRMHKLGILDEDEVLRAYRDIGYAPDKATNMTRFTVELNKPPPTKDTKTLEDLTRSNVLGFYADGIIDRREATNLLRRGGFTDDVIDLFIDSTDLAIERDERKDAIATVLEKAKAGTISVDEAQDQLDRLGLSTLERTKAMNRLVREQAAKVKLPSKADLGKFLKAGIIDRAAFLDGLGRLGYSGAWAERYAQLAEGSTARAT